MISSSLLLIAIQYSSIKEANEKHVITKIQSTQFKPTQNIQKKKKYFASLVAVIEDQLL